MDTQKKDLLSVEESKPTETSDMLVSVTDKSIAQNSPKLEEKIVSVPCKDRINTSKLFESDPEFFKNVGIPKKNKLVEWIKKHNYMVKGDNGNYMATEWSEKNRYAINLKTINIHCETVLMNNDSLGYIPTRFFHTYCGYFTQKGIDHIKNELEKERRQENEY